MFHDKYCEEICFRGSLSSEDKKQLVNLLIMKRVIIFLLQKVYSPRMSHTDREGSDLILVITQVSLGCNSYKIHNHLGYI